MHLARTAATSLPRDRMPHPLRQSTLDIPGGHVRLTVVTEGNRASAEPESVLEQLRAGTCDWADPRIPALLAWLRAGQRRSELQALLHATSIRVHTLNPTHALPLIQLLSDLELVPAAYALSTLPQLTHDPEIALQRARIAMRQRNYPAAIAASEVAIGALLQPGVTVEELLRLCVAGASPDGLLRFERHVLADRVHLSERLALRWEALHRAGQRREANLMQLMCQRYFPERASVWATAGNHALDADDAQNAQRYFERCLQLDADWTAALAGLAIVHERQKDWAAALPYRRRVLELERALERDDAASLQRRIRYAAALARLGRWEQAEPLFRSAARAPELARLPAERPVLLRVFTQELYAPALVGALLDGDRGALEPGAALARHEASLLAQLELQLLAAAEDRAERRWALGLCAYLSGDLERAFELLDRVEDDRPHDLAVQHLLLRCASALQHEQTASIRAFAEAAARTLWTERGAAELPLTQLVHAVALVPELATEAQAAGHALPADDLDELEPLDAPLLQQLERVAGFRAAHRAAGRSSLAAAAASTHALAAIALRA